MKNFPRSMGGGVVLAGVLLMAASAGASTTNIVYLSGDNTPNDSSGNSNNATWTGTPAYAPIGSTTGFNLSGSNSLYIPASSALNIPTGDVITISALVDPNDTSLSSERIIDRISAGGSDGYLLDILNDKFRVIVGGTVLTSTNTVTADTVYKVEVVYDGTATTPTLTLYENGVENTYSTAGAFAEDTDSNLRIGVDSTGASNFNGVIADASISYGTTVPTVSPAPEPAAWALMLIGVGGVGGAMRARRGRSPMAV